MRFAGFIYTSTQLRSKAKICRAAGTWTLLLIWIALATICSAQGARETPLGLAWDVKGLWLVNSETSPLHTGDTVEPGALLKPAVGSIAHSITILLPDGQRILYECYQAEDCARGFRVPLLYHNPESLAVNMLWRIHAVLAKTARESGGDGNQSVLPREEAIAVPDGQNKAEVEGLVAALPDGLYHYTERELGHVNAVPVRKTIEKKGKSVIFDIPSPGIYDIIIADRLNTPRIDLMIGAVRPPKGAIIRDAFLKAKSMLENWNGDYQGWPVHAFQRAYLEALVLDINPHVPNVVTSENPMNQPGVVHEPVFTPRPGVLKGDTAVSLRCDTPGATIHFTVDGSQPLSSSPVYSAPIMVKGTALTIKAFATSKEKDQSDVVTGIFRIEQ